MCVSAEIQYEIVAGTRTNHHPLRKLLSRLFADEAAAKHESFAKNLHLNSGPFGVWPKSSSPQSVSTHFLGHTYGRLYISTADPAGSAIAIAAADADPRIKFLVHLQHS